jgi:RNAse (barnase) inhibitor barstar
LNTRGATVDIADPQSSGVFFVGAADLPPLAHAAQRIGFTVAQLDLRQCPDKAHLLDQLAIELELPDDFGRNWDALADSLCDLSWLQAPGYLLLFAHADALQGASEPDFDTLIEILEDAAAAWRAQGVPFLAFLALPDSAFDAT